MLSDHLSSVHHARHDAAGLSGHLVTIPSQAEKDIVQSLVDSAGGGYALIGWVDFETENHHTWLNRETVNYSNWQTGQPNNMAHGNCLPNYVPDCEEDAVTIAGANHQELGGGMMFPTITPTALS